MVAQLAKRIYLNKPIIALGIISLIFIIIFFRLSAWQYHRYLEKQLISSKLQQNIYSQPADYKNINLSNQYDSISLTGIYDDEKTVFLTNQYIANVNTPGFNVITPLLIENTSTYILINRGWIKSPLDYLKHKKNDHTNKVNLAGIIQNSQHTKYIMGKNIYPLSSNSSILTVQKLDLKNHYSNTNDNLNTNSNSNSKSTDNLLDLFNYQLINKYIKITNSNNPIDQKLNTKWIWLNITPEKHLGYCIQWILLAITVILLYSYFCYTVLKK